MTHSRQKQLEFGDNINFFNELFLNYEIDPKLQQLASNEIHDYESNYEMRNFYKKGKILSETVFLQIESSINQKFISKFPLFKTLNLNTIRLLRFNHKVLHNSVVIRKDQDLTGIMFVTRGNIQLYNDEMILQKEYFKGDMFGFR